MRFLLSVLLIILLSCVAIDAYTLHKSYSEYAKLPTKEAHIQLIDRRGYSRCVKVKITAESELFLDRGVLYERFKSVKKQIGHCNEYKILLIKER